MQPRVIAILAARNGAEYLDRTTAALAKLTRQPDVIIAVDAGGADGSSERLAAVNPVQLVVAPEKHSYGSAIAHALQVAAPESTDNDWLWLLGHDNAPEPRALAELLAAVEVAPSVGIAGPKLMRWDDPPVIAQFGETMTRWGTSVALVENELDQAQHDTQNDVMAVSAAGMLVRRSVWSALGGFDPALPGIDAALDFCVRARLSGQRVITVPGARIASAGGPEDFGQRADVNEVNRRRLARSAQLHRRLVYAPLVALPIHWLSLVPLAAIRSLGHVIAKRPEAVPGELVAALHAAFSFSSVGAARRNLRKTRRVGWGAVTELRPRWADVRERRAQAREERAALAAPGDEPRASFIASGGLWVTFAIAIVSMVIFAGLFGATTIVGGGLHPLSRTVAELWAHVGYGWREIGVGFLGAADPFSYLVAILGSITFWAPSLSVVVLYLTAMPLAALAAWFCARPVSRHTWLPVIAAIAWAFAPPFLAALDAGQLGGVLTHLLLPWLLLACFGARSASRSWPSTATAALLFAAVAAASPILIPALVVGWLVWLATKPKSAHRLLLVPIPAAVLFAPLVVQQFLRGNLLGVLADPGLPVHLSAVPGWQLALGSPALGLNGWTQALAFLSLDAVPAAVVVAVLLAPVGILALLALALPGSRRALLPLGIALLGYLTAVAATHLQLASIGGVSTTVWAGAGLSVFWLGLFGSALMALDAIGRAALASAVAAGTALCLAALPLLAAPLIGAAAAQASTGRIVPAIVSAQADSRPDIGTLTLTVTADGGLAVELQRGHGTALDDQATLDSTAIRLTDGDKKLATLAGNLVSRSGYDASKELANLAIGFVILTSDHAPASSQYRPDDAAGGTATSVYLRAVDALDGNALFAPVGETADGLLWRTQTEPPTIEVIPVGNTDTTVGKLTLSAQAVVFGITLLLAIPTERRRRTVHTATDFDEPIGELVEDVNV